MALLLCSFLGVGIECSVIPHMDRELDHFWSVHWRQN